MATPTTLTDLNQLVHLGIQENLHLDYKDSRALAKDRRDEIVKDVSAFANADGGTLIYGIREKDHLPETLDEGVSNQEISREWVEQILQSNITPPIVGIEIYQIPKDTEKSYFVVYVPKSYRGPHQASDKKYYKRYNFKSSPMDHYEVVDVATRRQRVPRIFVLDIEVDNNVFKLVCANMGTEPVTDVSFSFPHGFQWPSGEMPYALKAGIRYFPPGRKFKFFYSGTVEALEPNSKILGSFAVEAKYLRPELDLPISEVFNINLHDFLGTTVETEGTDAIVRAIDRGFRTLKDALNNIGRNLK